MVTINSMARPYTKSNNFNPQTIKLHVLRLIDILHVLLTVYHSISVQLNQRDSLFIQFIENQGPLHVSGITCTSSEGASKTAFGILLAYNVSWLEKGCS
jgi:hypothetical protein